MATPNTIQLRPFRDYNEHDVINLFSFNQISGNKGGVVKIVGSGWNNSFNYGIAYNINNGVPNVYTPRYETKAKVDYAGSGDTALGLMLYDVREYNQFGYPLIYDPVRLAEAQAVVSGATVPILTRGLVLLGPFTTGVGTPLPGSGLIPTLTGNAGEVQVVAPGVTTVNPATYLSGSLISGSPFNVPAYPFNNLGKFLGPIDSAGFALFKLDVK